MALLLPLTDTAITDCRNHLNKYPDIDPAVLSYLTRHVNGLMCAEIESVITRLIRERIAVGCSDEASLSFLQSMRRNVIRNAKYSEICDKLTLLGDKYKSKFAEDVEKVVGEHGIERLGIAVGKRDSDAHHQPPDITFRELEEVYSIATAVVDAAKRVLEM